MKNFKSLQASTTVTKRQKISENPVNAEVIALKCYLPKGNGPHTYSVVFLQDISIPYLHPEPGKKQSARVNFFELDEENPPPPLEMKAGVESHYVSMFKGESITDGGFYQLEDLSYHIFLSDPNLQALHSIGAKRITPIRMPNIKERIYQSIPFVSRSISYDRDLSFERDMNSKNRYLLVVEIPGMSEVLPNPEVSTIYGSFTLPPANIPPMTSCQVPIDVIGGPTKEVLAFVGVPGMLQNEVPGSSPDNQLKMMQVDGGNETAILGFTKLYEDSLSRLQMDWKIMAQTIIPYLSGLNLCSIDPKKTRALNLTDDVYAGIVKLGSCFYPNLADMVRLCGFRLSYSSCQAMEPRLKDDFIVSKEKQINKFWVNAINLVTFNGTLKGFKAGAQRGQVELFALTNRPMNLAKRTQIQKKTESEIFGELMDDAEYSQGDKYIAIFAVCAVGYPGSIADFTFLEEKKKEPLI